MARFPQNQRGTPLKSSHFRGIMGAMKNLEKYGVKMPTPEGTYLLFADFSEYCEKTGKTLDEVEQAMWDVGVSVQDGREFHGPCHIRINVALPFALIQEACDRMEKYVFND